MIRGSEPDLRVRLPDASVLVAGHRGCAVLGPDGEIETVDRAAAQRRLRPDRPVVVCHARATARRIGVRELAALDVLELFAFVHPARFCVPTPAGLAAALDVALPRTLEDQAVALHGAMTALLRACAEHATAATDADDARAVAMAMAQGGWGWGPMVLAALGPDDKARPAADALKVWGRMPVWEDAAPPPPPKTVAVSAADVGARLSTLLGPRSERRAEQKAFAEAAAAAFQPRDAADAPRVVLAEAGTGVGKTLGYIAPASLWAEASGGTVWMSTYTRNLQRQLDGELDRLFPDPDEKAARVVVRKGRENYLCLLNFQDAVGRMPTRGSGDAVALGLMARWIKASRDGDMVGGDFPSWLADLLGRGLTMDLTDTRGECVYAACDHYRKCLIEHAARKSRRADIVVANHALVMVQAALGGTDPQDLPLRYVFDEGHHLFEAADSAFAQDLGGRETADLRRWLIGSETQSRSRARGLRNRISDLVSGDADAEPALDAVLQAARVLPAPGWQARLGADNPQGPAEAFLAAVRRQVYARAAETDTPYSLECDTHPPLDGLLTVAADLNRGLERLETPAKALMAAFRARLAGDEAEELESAERVRLDAAVRSLERRVLMACAGWRAMLASLAAETPETACDWMTVERIAGREVDVSLRRHWIDPMTPFAETVFAQAHGALITSATLRDPAPDDGPGASMLGGGPAPHGDTDDPAWLSADRRTGAVHLADPPDRFAAASPFDFAADSRVFVVGDVGRNDPDQVAAAYRALFEAAGGGALGLFTAITRLRAVHERIAGPLEDAGFPLYAQHVDALDTGTLIDIFRAEEDACLLGTDAVRDGVDVPGRALRLIVFDRVPWPRPEILHRARRARFGGKAYDEMLCRLRLRQAFGRLIRRTGDRGVFVLLDRALPSRIARAFPEAAPLARVGLKEAVAETRAFLQRTDGPD
jgi:ATP-dependent DNA helicase DinG